MHCRRKVATCTTASSQQRSKDHLPTETTTKKTVTLRALEDDLKPLNSEMRGVRLCTDKAML